MPGTAGAAEWFPPRLFNLKKMPTPSAGYNINPAFSSATPSAAGAALGYSFYNSAGITFGNSEVGPASLSNTPSQTNTDPATASASAAGGNNAGSSAGGALAAASSGLLSNPLVLIVLVGVGGFLIYKAVKKKGK